MALSLQNSTNLAKPVAGSRLGLTREDLLSLLFEDEDKNSTDSLDLYQGVSPAELNEPQGSILQSSLSQEPSQTTATFKTKGRGNVLGYRSGPSPTVEISGPIEEVIPLVPGPTGGLGGPEPLPGARGIETSKVSTPTPAPTPEPVVQEKADRLLSSFIGEMGREMNPNLNAIGAMGVGRAMEYGYTPEQIKAKAQQEGLTFGEQAARGLGVSTPTRASAPSPASTIESIGKRESQEPFKQMTGSIGKAGIERAAAQLGISPQEAARRAQSQGTTLGPAAMALLG